MSIRFQTLMFMRIAILALLAGFSAVSFAGSRVASPYHTTAMCFPSPEAACDSLDGTTLWGTSRSLGNVYYLPPPTNQCYSPNEGSFGATVVACDVACPAGEIRVGGLCTLPEPCPQGQERDSESNECVWITACPEGQSLFQTKSSGGAITGAFCSPNVPTPNQKCVTYEDMQTAYCQEQAQACTSTGGTFGSVDGGTAGLHNVCVPPGAAANLPTCASGSMNMIENPDGSTGFACSTVGNGATPPDPIAPDATTQQSGVATANGISALGGLLQSGFAGVVNAIKAQGSGGGGSGSGSTAAQDSANTGAIVDAINEFANQEKGAGQCDPKAQNYAQCVGQTSEAPDSDGSTIADGVESEGQSVLDGIETSIKSAIENRGEVEEPTSIVDNLKAMLPHPASCTDLSFTFKGATFAVTCAGTELYRQWAEFFLAIVTAIVCFRIAFGAKEA